MLGVVFNCCKKFQVSESYLPVNASKCWYLPVNATSMANILISGQNLVYRRSYMSAHVLLNLLNKLRKSNKMLGLPSILSLFHEFNRSIPQEHDCLILFITRH